jgi:hypothetical protein
MIAAVGKPTANPTPHPVIHIGMKLLTNPTFIASIANDITKLIPIAIRKLINIPASLGLPFIL